MLISPPTYNVLKWNEDFTHIAPRPTKVLPFTVTAYTFQAHAYREEITPNVCSYNSTVDLQGQ